MVSPLSLNSLSFWVLNLAISSRVWTLEMFFWRGRRRAAALRYLFSLYCRNLLEPTRHWGAPTKVNIIIIESCISICISHDNMMIFWGVNRKRILMSDERWWRRGKKTLLILNTRCARKSYWWLVVVFVCLSSPKIKCPILNFLSQPLRGNWRGKIHINRLILSSTTECTIRLWIQLFRR